MEATTNCRFSTGSKQIELGPSDGAVLGIPRLGKAVSGSVFEVVRWPNSFTCRNDRLPLSRPTGPSESR